MLARVLSAAVVIFLISPVSEAAKLYKIVNPDGSITYSQYPPPDAKEKNKKVEDVVVDQSGETTVTDVGGLKYCGDIRLPSSKGYYHRNLADFAESVDRNRERWSSELKGIERSTARLSAQQFKSGMNSYKYKDSNSYGYNRRYSDGYNDRKQHDKQRMRDLRCALHWAEDYRKGVNHSDNEKEITRLKGIKLTLEKKISRVCGELPPYDPSDKIVESQRAKWYRCSRSYRNDVSRLDEKIRRISY